MKISWVLSRPIKATFALSRSRTLAFRTWVPKTAYILTSKQTNSSIPKIKQQAYFSLARIPLTQLRLLECKALRKNRHRPHIHYSITEIKMTRFRILSEIGSRGTTTWSQNQNTVQFTGASTMSLGAKLPGRATDYNSLIASEKINSCKL